MKEHFSPFWNGFMGRFSVLVLIPGIALLTLPGSAVAAEFRHPGILNDHAGLETTRRSLMAGDAEKLRMLSDMKASPLSALNYDPSPVAAVVCGPHSKPDIGCKAEVRDAQAAYTQALLWIYERDNRRARNAIRIMDAWSATLTGGHQGSNAPLQAAWAAQLWTRAAEIIRYSGSGWLEKDSRYFGGWLLAQYLPDIDRMGACMNGNWQASAIDARMSIGVYTDRRDIYQRAVADWNAQLPAYIYLRSDGAIPRQMPGCGRPVRQAWYGQKVFKSGMVQEMCRDLRHTAFGLAAYLNAAETDRIQGGTLYASGRERLGAALEFVTEYGSGQQVPAWLCGGKLKSNLDGTLEIGFAQLHGRMGLPMPNTQRWLRDEAPSAGTKHFLWESMTHGSEVRAARSRVVENNDSVED
ncbi:TPA: alginate lyase family protein [Stenotrophomonas maltophilia]|uniref:alginate lyase family protein n=1 Tax=Stenotrophomonas TaxID=40323 RepID=UPI0013DCD511|nr:MULTISPECIES: alginate lyase family protein [Stenotrophomonas]MBH1590913.1 alginate lyase family protein [Stenotrophomonas maltophilia]MDH2021666.1 alginate lyase family protein [Stenotrophomonas sp. GD03680]HEL3748091.1 alginate lyase family protein [Stenotrophomonas maltophilia]HEL7728931.1 alginate lyase family protein [Stenotrophomonas maltophilia]